MTVGIEGGKKAARIRDAIAKTGNWAGMGTDNWGRAGRENVSGKSWFRGCPAK
jgi:hypothetical protein